MFFFCFFTLLIKSENLPDLKPILDAQIDKNVIEIPKGRYLLNLDKDGAYEFINLNNVKIHGNGAEIVCNSQERALAFYNCKKVEISDLFIDYDPLCFTQGKIILKNDKENWFEVEIDSGYPTENLTTGRIQFFDSETRELKKNSITTYKGNYSSLDKIGERRYRAIKKGNWDAGERIGDLVVFNVISHKKNAPPHAMYLKQCEEMSLNNIHIYSANSFSFFEDNCSGNHYNQCVVDRGISKQGISTRLRSGNADGINSNNARKGPIVENCRIKYNGDDCIIVNGRSFPICKIDKFNRLIYILSRVEQPLFEVRDSIQHVQYNGLKNDTILSVVSTYPYKPNTNDISFLISKYPHLLNKESYTKGLCLEVNFLPSNIESGDILYNLSHVGRGFIIKNNEVGFNRSRGLLVKADKGIIEGNSISNCAMNGILVSPEINWMGGGFSNDIIIRNNSITECMYEKTNFGMPPGSLSIFSSTGDGKISINGAFRNISVYNNVFFSCPFPCIVFTSVKGLLAEQNKIIQNSIFPREHGKSFGTDFSLPIWEINNEKNQNSPTNKIDF